MAPLSGHRRPRAELEDGDEADSSDHDSSSPASSRSKRQRIDTPQSADPEDEGSDTSRTQVPATNGHANIDEVPDFSPGAIVRVTVENFVTYEKAEFFPGPNLNMVIGPNGTGKSSLVCAICLGLGYGPKHLGRAGSVKEFVKHGKDNAIVEIELKKKSGDRSNPVIRLQIRKEQNNQKWWLNGKETTHKKIQELTRSLKIQVDNLCQFLPQDRVVEFAQCGPVELLHETLRAAAPEEMLMWQSQLKDLQKDKKELTSAASSDGDTLKNLENRQQGLQAEVDRLRERNEILQKVEDYKSALILARYQEARTKFSEAKEKKKQAQLDLREAEEASGPALEAVNDKERYSRQIEIAISAKATAVKDAENKLRRATTNVEAIVDEIKVLGDKISSEEKGYDKQKREIGVSRQKLTNYQADLKNQPAPFSAADWNIKIRAEEHKERDLEEQSRELTEEIDKLAAQGGVMKQDIKRIEKEMTDLDTQQGQQMTFMKKFMPEVAQGWEWVQANQDKFEKEVLGPPMVSCSMKDERYSDLVQSLMMSDDFTCFTAQTKNDYLTLSDQLHREMSLSIVIRTCVNPLSAYRSPLTLEAAQQLGLEGFAIDFIDGPEPVLAMLCAEKRLHLSGVALKEHTDKDYDRIMKSGQVNSWAAGRSSVMIRRRKEYGPQAMTAVTKTIQPGKFWTSQPIDASERTELERKLAEIRAERESLASVYRENKAKVSAIKEEQEEVAKRIDQLKSDKAAVQKEFNKWQALPKKIEDEEENRTRGEAVLRAGRKKIADLEREIDDATVRQMEAVLNHAGALEQVKAAFDELRLASIWHKESLSDLDGLKAQNAALMDRLEEQKRIIAEATEEADNLKQSAVQLRQEVQVVMAEITEAKTTELHELTQNKSAEDIQMELDAEAAKLELIHAANPNVIQDFERRETEIAKLRRKMDGLNEKMASIAGEVDQLMGQFEPRLDELVGRISDAFAYNFEQISCAGEVRVHKDPDFEQWALDIMVKFRENEELQQLNAHRQSGGERAVSTIFFLMALQSMAQSPFRVVDEINQGMDPRNERMVHERMVEIACREHTSQYFLITPKLLTGLKYDPKMRVLCIASGEHMPKEGRKLDFGRCLKVQRRLMASA